MANTIPCPNPVCTHTFSLAELQSASQLACPKCGFKMQGKAPAPAKPIPKPATKPPVKAAAAPPSIAPKVAVATPVQAKASSPVAAATPVAAGPAPAAVPVSSEASFDGSFFNPGSGAAGPLVLSKSAAKKPFNWLRLLLVFFAVGFAGSIIVVVLVLLIPQLRSLRDSGSTEKYTDVGNIRNSNDQKETVYGLNLPRGEWAYDGELESRFRGPAARDNLVSAWKDTTGYDFWFAVVVKDHTMYRPRDTEMLRLAVDKLETQFGVDMELDSPEGAKFGSLPARKVKFRGVRMDVKWEGEAWMIFSNGIAYYLFLAAPSRDVVDYFADQLPQKHFFVISSRQGWREQPWPTETFATRDNKLEVSAPKGVWEKSTPTKDEKLLLGGKYLRQKDNKKNALMIVYALEKQDDLKAVLKEAREQLETREKDSNNMAKVVHAAEVVPGQPEAGSADRNIGEKGGRLIDLKLMIGDEKDAHRYYLLAVVTETDASYAILCECSWASRQIWRQDFLDVIASFRVK